MDITKEILIRKYNELKNEKGKTPGAKEFCKYAGIHGRKLIEIYGEDAFSKLQIDCGDDASKLHLIRTPLEKIMRQYGDLAMELGKLPSSSNWIHKKLRPTVSGLEKQPHFIKWSEFPEKFTNWVESNGITEYEKVLELINDSAVNINSIKNKTDDVFVKIINDIRNWSPAIRRNSEGEYKIELRKHLESLGHILNEEYGESKFDLLIEKKYAVEIKKSPNLGEYDRLFGQLARHLQHQKNVIALIMDVPREDNYTNFVELVDEYLSKDQKLIEVIKK